jgi:hypothetical protein
MTEEAAAAEAHQDGVTDAPQQNGVDTPALEFNTYMESLSDAHKELLSKNNVDSFEAQEKWTSGLNSALGKKAPLRPEEGAPEAEVKAYQDALKNELGRPDDGKYEFDLSEGSKEEYYSDEFFNGLAGIAFDAGMSAEGYQKLVDHLSTNFNTVIEGFEGQFAELKEKLGEDTMDDSAGSADSMSRDSIHDAAKTKSDEATAAFNRQDYKEADRLHKEARDLYARMENAS